MDDSSQSDDDFELTPDISEVELKSEPLDDDLVGDDASDKDGSRPVRPVERQKMRPWLVELLDSNNVPGLSWQNRKDRIFRISWKHAAHNCFNRTRDSDLFERWAYHTGRHYEGNHKRWKANFRCALNSLPDVIELRDLGVRKGDNAFKVYKFLEGTDPMYKDKMDPKKKHSTSSSQLKRTESKSEATSSGEGSSIPTSPEHETEEEGGMNALLKAIELHTQGEGGKRDKHGKRGSRLDEGQSSPKRMKRDKEMSNIPTIVHDDDIPVVKGQADTSAKKSASSSSGAESSKSTAARNVSPSVPSSTQTSSSTLTSSVTESSQVASQVLVGGTAGGQQVLSVLPKYPYLQTLEQKSGKITIVHLRKSDKDGGSIVQLSASEVCNMLNQDPKLMAVPVTMTTSEGGAASISTQNAVMSSGQGQGQILLSSEDLSGLKATYQAPQMTSSLKVQGQTASLQPGVNKSQDSKSQSKDSVSTSSDLPVNNMPLTSVTVSLQGVESKIPVQGKIGMPVPLPVHLTTMIQSPVTTSPDQKLSQPLTSIPQADNTSAKTSDLPSVTTSIPGEGQVQPQSQGHSKVQNIPAPVADMLAWMKSHADSGGELALKAAGHSLLISNAMSTCVTTVASPSVSTSVSTPVTSTTVLTTSSTSATFSAIQSNKSIVNRFSSIAEALSMASGSSVMPEIRAIRTQDVVNSVPKNLVPTTTAVSTPMNSSINPVIPTDSQNVRSKLVTRLLVSGTSPGLTSMGTMVRHPVPVQPSLVACNPMVVTSQIPPRHIDPNLARGVTPHVRPPVTSVTPSVPIAMNDLRMGSPGIVVTAVSANLLGRTFSTSSSVALAGSAVMSDALKNGTLSQKPAKTSTQIEPELSPPALIRMDQVATEISDTSNTNKETDPALDSDMPELEQQKEVSNIKPEYLKEHITIELGNIAEDSSIDGPGGDGPPGREQYYFCLWCQKHFSRKVDLLQHFMSLHQDMLIVPGASEGSEPSLDMNKIQELVTMAKVNSSGLTSASGGVVTFQHGESHSDTKNEKGLYTVCGESGISSLQGSLPQENVLDLTTKKRDSKLSEVLDLRKKGRGRGKPKGATSSSKKSAGVGKTRKTASKNKDQSEVPIIENDNVIGQFDIPNNDGQKVIVQAIPTVVSTSENLIGQPKVFDSLESGNMSQPKYCLNSLIAALRDSIERDKKDHDIPGYGQEETDDDSEGMEDDAGSATSYGEASEEDSLHSDTENKTSDDLYRGLSPDSQSEEEETESVLGVDKEIQVSLKTVVVDGKTMYRCSKCNKMFSKTCTFARHAMVHAKLYPYQCGICDEMKCSDMRVLLRHLDWHGENVECPCKKCERLYKEDLKTEADQTKDLACRFGCEICGKKFISDVVCKAHVNMHRRKTIECEICKMEFKCNRNLSKHRKLAHGVQFCPVCFESCRDIATHIHLHSGIFMYKCGLCGDAFNSRPLLHDHLKVHTHLGKNIGPNKSPQKDASRSKSKGSSSSFGTQSSISSEIKIQTLKMQKGSDKNLKVSKGKKGSLKSVSQQIDTGSNASLREETDSPRPDTSRSPKGKMRPDIESLISEDSVGAISESSASNISASGDGNSGSMSLRKRKARRCRWHDNDSVCERCDETFIKTIAFGRKPKSKSGKDSPRIDDNESRSSVRTLNDFSDSSDGLEDPHVPSVPANTSELNLEQLN